MGNSQEVSGERWRTQIGTCCTSAHDGAHTERGDCEHWYPQSPPDPLEELLRVKVENERLKTALRKIHRLTNRQIGDAPWNVKTIAREALRG